MKRTILFFSVITLLVSICNAQSKPVKNTMKSTSSTKQEVVKTTKMQTQQPFKLLFSGEQDLINTWDMNRFCSHTGILPVK